MSFFFSFKCEFHLISCPLLHKTHIHSFEMTVYGVNCYLQTAVYGRFFYSKTNLDLKQASNNEQNEIKMSICIEIPFSFVVSVWSMERKITGSRQKEFFFFCTILFAK